MIPAKRSQNWLPSIFNDFFGNEWLAKANSNSPAINIRETEDRYEVEVAAPGLTKDDFKIRIEDDNQLIVTMDKSSENKEEKEEGRYLRREFYYSHFQQSMILPENIDKERIGAKVENGVLTIDIPKRKEEERVPAAKEIAIR
ncbi:Hsp20/alpha crystallin family protein [Rikenella microfusus]|uniref:Spore protein SP21 n=2 Tax=Rikenella microfusus TaxID=28139 RepID=A0A379MWU1_9BACT|nr:Hsp20/alpha crystallin family protein [Rikenella microfusus]SUE35102.1 Spore protein SP21 [Rikenella microfusus]